MVCGGLGLVIAAALFFGWRNSEVKWQRVVALIAGVWGGISVAFYVAAGGLYVIRQHGESRSQEFALTPMQTQEQALTAPESPAEATQRPTNTPRATDTPEPTRTPVPTESPVPSPGDILLQDSFSGPDSNTKWLLGEDEGCSAVIEDGRLELSAADADALAWAESTRAYSGIDLRVDVTILEGGKEATYGILFGIGPSDDNYAVCFAGGDDSALCGVALNGETESGRLAQVEVSPQDISSLIRLVTWGDQWAFYVNGKCAGSGESAVAETGKVGLLAATDSASSASEIAYDDLVIRVPDSASRALLSCDPDTYAIPTAPPPQPTSPPESGGYGTIHLSSETSAAATCRLSVWGGSTDDFLLDAGPGSPASRVVPPGQYGWQMHFGPAGSTDAATMQLPAGGSCSFICTDSGVQWGCGR